MQFIKSNPHPTGKKIGDCVIRALSYAESKKWIDVYKELCKIGEEILDLPNCKPVFEVWLTRNGWTKHKMPRHTNGRRMKLSEFVDLNPKKSFVANVVSHTAYVENGTLIDLWDCGHKCIGNYYTKN